MTNFKRYFLLFFITFTFLAQASYAEGLVCRSLFATSFTTLPQIIDVDLPQSFIEAIKKHPIMKLKEKYENKLAYVEQFDMFGDHRGGFMGETIQMNFIAKTLKVIFGDKVVVKVPYLRGENDSSAETWVEKWKKRNPEKIKLDFIVVDHAEHRTSKKNILPMTVLKAANPGLGSIPHNTYRAELGIPESAVAISLYLSGMTNDILKIVEAVDRHSTPDIIFFSQGGKTSLESQQVTKQVIQLLPHYKMIYLSEVREADFNSGQKLIILNDTKGKVPFIANVADLVIVSGPINFFEPISAGAKTVIVQSSFSEFHYYKNKAYKEMVAKALESGANWVSGTDELAHMMLQIMTSNKEVKPTFLAKTGRRSSVDEYLDVLKSEIERLTM